MLTNFTKFIIFLIKFIDFFIYKLFRIDFYGFLVDKIIQRYESIYIKNKKIKFFIPNHISKWRIKTFYSKEPETLDWIDNFKKNKPIFWDIGSNIGLYSIYASAVHKNIKIYAFEPSFLNLNVLSRNIFINNLGRKIKIFQIPLNNKNFNFSQMNETTLSIAGAFSGFKNNLKSYDGKKILNSYQILGVSLDTLVKNKIIEIPDYIKIDVDGLEYLILSGFSNFLSDKKIKSILIEIDERKKKINNKIFKLLNKKHFIFYKKEQSQISKEGNLKVFNYIFKKK